MGKVILLTGASTGIGAGTARMLAPGNKLFLHYNASGEAAGQVKKEVEALGGEALLLQADITTEAACERLVDEVKARTDYLDVLINNAGGW